MLAALAFLHFVSQAAPAPVKIAVHASQTGRGSFSGRALVEGVQMAVHEANARARGPRIVLMEEDDESSEESAVKVAQKIADSDAVPVIGPALTTAAEVAAPIYEKKGIAALVATAHGDDITGKGGTSFLLTVRTSDMGKALANYLRHVLEVKNAAVISSDDGYGRTFEAGFRRVAEYGGVKATYYKINTADKLVEQEEKIAGEIACDQEQAAIVFGMTQVGAAPMLKRLRRKGCKGPYLGTTTMARASFPPDFQNEPEEKHTPGYFTDGVYAASPVLLESANADTLAFVRRFRARYKHEPSWEAVQSYDALMLAAEGMNFVSAQHGGQFGPGEGRKDLLEYLKSGGSGRAVKSLPGGGVWLPDERRRELPLRIGRYQGTLLKSALTQLVPVPNTDPVEVASGRLVDLGGGQYARRQRVVYSGLYINEILRVNIAQSTFTTDFYQWMRYAKSKETATDGDPEKDADPGKIVFPDLIQGSQDSREEIKLYGQSEPADGTRYRLWHVRGEFKTNFDFHHFPLDEQSLTLRFLHAQADSSRVVYVKDGEDPDPNNVEQEPFRGLTQYNVAGISQQRYAFSTRSDLGNEQAFGLERGRELSGYNVTVKLRRSVISAMTKTMLPLAVMTLIMYAALYFPHGLVKETVMVVVTVALAGTVLLSSINSQLGDVGYILAAEYVFYFFFALCLFSMVAVAAAERACGGTGPICPQGGAYDTGSFRFFSRGGASGGMAHLPGVVEGRAAGVRCWPTFTV
jgi:ABC-type branched-subunit amino acid transport system substrate-binding protein